MACTNCRTVDDILDGLRTVDQWCAKKVDRVNRILRNFYLSTVGFADNIVAQPISWTGQMTITTITPIYKVMGFFWSWCWEACYIDQYNKCCWETTKALKMFRTNLQPKTWQYRMNCETELTAVIPAWFTDWYFLYSTWPKEISSTSEEICIDWVMLSWLEYYMEMFYEAIEWESNRMQVSQQRYNEWLSNTKDAQSNRVFEVKNWDWTMLW